MKKLLDELSKLYKQIATHKEDYQMVTDPGYCDYLHLQLYGKEFPNELTHHRKGFLLRVPYATDGPVIEGWLRKIFSLKKYTYDERNKAQMMKIITRESPSVDMIDGKLQHHWQEEPLIVMVL